jgi:hypothetical protein
MPRLSPGRASCEREDAGVTHTIERTHSDAPRAPVIVPAGSMPRPPGSGVTNPARRNRTRPISRLSPVDIPSRARCKHDIRARPQSQMIGERRVFVSMNEGVEKIAKTLRKGAATFTREDSQTKRAKSQCLSAFPTRTQQNAVPHLGRQPYALAQRATRAEKNLSSPTLARDPKTHASIAEQ